MTFDRLLTVVILFTGLPSWIFVSFVVDGFSQRLMKGFNHRGHEGSQRKAVSLGPCFCLGGLRDFRGYVL
jgi:hypothetical protein